jgi:hypothetical protein
LRQDATIVLTNTGPGLYEILGGSGPLADELPPATNWRISDLLNCATERNWELEAEQTRGKLRTLYFGRTG